MIQCDCDGQHHIEDIDRCAQLLRQNPNKFILGVRDFSDKSIPLRSRFGNNCTSFVFKAFCGLDLKDTQSGLKGIPASFLPFLMETPGERFEYASSVLLETKRQGMEILQFPIHTIYINGNETSHFNPLIDSVRIYSLILKYMMSSLSSFIIDIVLYSIFISLLRDISNGYYIIASTYLAKFFSCTYGYAINKKMVFQSKGKPAVTAIKFFLLCVAQSTCSGFVTREFVLLTQWNEVFCKIIVDTLLFFISFQIQSRWVFSYKAG
ncbi:MAG: glycosyl transferase [Clostridium sp.]|nr:glycosyl transferase [Clostridium sp.]